MKTTIIKPGGRRKAAAAILTAALIGTTLSSFAAASAGAAIPAAPGSHAVSSVPAAALTQVNVPGTTALSAAAVDLAKYGYTEREFYAAGTANRYRGAVAGSLQTATVIDGGWAYRTRVLVRAPKPDHFNGTLLVEWTNVTIGVDADFVFAEAHEDLLRQGYAYAVVSVQKVGVDRLKSWSPARYGTLSVDASNVDPQGGGNIDNCGPIACAGDPLSWDVYSQVAQALKVNAGGAHAPFPGLKIHDVIATGQSQSAFRISTYYNTIQPLANVFDGFVMWDRAGLLRSDLKVPEVSVNSEGLSGLAPTFPTTTYTRAWEVAGSTHGSLYAAEYVDAMFNRDHALIGPTGQPESFSDWVDPSCAVLPAFSTVPNGLVVSAALDSVKKWIELRKPAPPTILFTRDASGNFVRDANGMIEGGVRLSQFVAPLAQISAFNGTAFPCLVSGWHRYFTQAELDQRYGTTRNYVAQVGAAMFTAAKGGYILPSDAVEATVAATKVSIG